MLIAIPSVTSYINNSRKETYVSTIQELIKGAVVKANSGDLEMYDTDTTYYIPTSAIKLESGDAKSPYGKLNDAYIVVTYDGEEYEYYYVGKDETGMGIDEITKGDKISKESIKEVDSVDKTVGLIGKSKIVVFDDDLNPGVPQNALSNASGAGSSNNISNQCVDEGNSIIVYPENKNKCTVEVGDEVAIGEEEFYVISNNNGNVALIAKYNLLVGNETFSGFGDGYNRPIKTTTDGYGKQKRSTVPSSYGIMGVVPFSGVNYWDENISYCSGTSGTINCTSSDNSLKGRYVDAGASYDGDPYPYVYAGNMSSVAPEYIYDLVQNQSVETSQGCGYALKNGYTISYYVDGYVELLKSMGAPSNISGRLLSYEEATELANSYKGNGNFWLGSAASNYEVFVIDSRNIKKYPFYRVINGPSSAAGVRPVIML